MLLAVRGPAPAAGECQAKEEGTTHPAVFNRKRLARHLRQAADGEEEDEEKKRQGASTRTRAAEKGRSYFRVAMDED